MKRVLFIISLVFLLNTYAPYAHADVQGDFYSFTGAGGLSGKIFIDDNASFVTLPDIGGVGYTLDSRLNSVAGSFGAFSFFGTGSNIELSIFNVFNPDAFSEGDWILRAGQPVFSPISSNSVGGVTVTGLNLFVDFPPGVLTGATRNVPLPTAFDLSHFDYSIVFSDGTFDTGKLTSLDRVFIPEPATLALVLPGLVGVLSLRARKRPRSVSL
jgi:hypothetical protein